MGIPKKVDVILLTRVAHDVMRTACFARCTRDMLTEILGEDHPSVEYAGEAANWLTATADAAADAVEVRTGKRPAIDGEEVRECFEERLRLNELEICLNTREKNHATAISIHRRSKRS